MFAGGCFWCLQAAFRDVKGVLKSVSGYSGGELENPTYEDVIYKKTGHREAVLVVYDDSVVEFDKLMDIFLKNIDPTNPYGQFADLGEQYTTAVFYYDEGQKKVAQEVLQKVKGNVTPVLPMKNFYIAEDYHQNFDLKNPIRYEEYKMLSGREDDNLSHLTPEQIEVTQKGGTEKPFENEYWNHYSDGIYVDVISGDPLFSSRHKYDSQTGWPSFTRPISDQNVKYKNDYSLIVPRKEVLGALSDSHLGHVFKDGPDGKLRYCINSAALRFVSKDNMFKEGYGDWIDKV